MSQYRSILKATTIFGGTQVLQILIQLIRTKFIALLIGGEGMGISALYVSTVAVFVTLFGLGLHTSVVRDLSKANDEGDEIGFSKISLVFKRMLYVLSFASIVFIILLSNSLSYLSFGDDLHVVEYVFLSLYVLFTILTQGNQAILTGKRRIKDLALCSLIGSVVTLITSVPFFYFFGLDGIVPGLIVSTFSNYLVTLLFTRKIKMIRVAIKWSDVSLYGKSILILGLTLSFSILIGNLTDYFINIGIGRLGDIRDLGYYNAGMSLTGRIISLIFASISADFFPRLVASFKSQSLMNETVNEECEIVLHLSAPILAVFSICSPLVIALLLSDEFLVINSFIRILCLGMFFKSLGYVLGNLSFAKGDKYVYLFFEAGYSNLANLSFSLVLYYFYGLKGVACGFVLCWILYSILIYLLDYYRYHFSVSVSAFKVIMINTILMSLVYLSNLYNHDNIPFSIISIIIVLATIIYNVKALNQKTGLFRTIMSSIQTRTEKHEV